MSQPTGTFHYPCGLCGQTMRVVDGVGQPHECATYDSDRERLCAAYWAGADAAAVAALRNAAAEIRATYAEAWGGDRSWLTTGNHVADLVGDVLEEMTTE